MKALVLIGIGLLLVSCTSTQVTQEVVHVEGEQVATFAGGCFWCVEADFEKIAGITEVVSGYTGGDVADPTYKQVSSGTTGHYEAVQVHFDPSRTSYRDLVEYFFRHVDPTDEGGQFVDRGQQYTTAIWYHDEEQRVIAEQVKASVEEQLGKPVVTPILPAEEFYLAEEYHQDYYDKNPLRYKFYRSGSGRDKYIDQTWGEEAHRTDFDGQQFASFSKPSDEQLKEQLTPLQYEVTQEDGTEPAFSNEYWNNTEPGIYVDVVSGEPLFSSLDQYKSGTGWPSFTQPIDSEYIVEKKDYKLIWPRTEIRSKYGDNHIGHVFKDGPKPTGLRYCMNSAALRFIHKDDLEAEGYGEYLSLFEEQ